VIRLYTDFNQPVKAGQVLAELDQALIRTSIAQIEANLKSVEATQRLAESTLKRNQELVAKGFISPATLEQNQKALDVSRAQIAQVGSQLERERSSKICGCIAKLTKAADLLLSKFRRFSCRR
jgi:HlyD family secretion protein